jgi:hypothetical protein
LDGNHNSELNVLWMLAPSPTPSNEDFPETVLATEWRTKVAHGATVGSRGKTEPAPAGAKEIFCRRVLSPLPGLKTLGRD